MQVVAGADTQDARLVVYEAALKRLQAAPPPAATDSEVADAEVALTAALAARRAANAAIAAAALTPNLPGYPVMPQLYRVAAPLSLAKAHAAPAALAR